MPGAFLPEFELYVMLAIARLGADAYGATILREIEERAERPVAIGALYATLSRLENKGLVVLSATEPQPGQRGRPRKYCSLTAEGKASLKHSVTMLGRMTEGLAYDSGWGRGQ